MTFEILTVDPTSTVGDEQLGSKNKFWFQRDSDRWLFKEARPNTGEDWAEKIAAEIGRGVGLQCAQVEFARFMNHRGVACRSFVSSKTLNLVHGNEILAGQIVGYDRHKKLHQSDHTLDNIVTAVRNLTGGAEFSRECLRLLAGYLVFDALICNTDRHHENWGFLVEVESGTRDGGSAFLQVAPSFDHASSLGRELTDERRQHDIQNSAVGQYAKRGRGGVYLNTADPKGANPLALVRFGLERYPDYFGPALETYRKAPLDGMLAVVDGVPESLMSSTAKTFAKHLLTFTKGFLQGLQP